MAPTHDFDAFLTGTLRDNLATLPVAIPRFRAPAPAISRRKSMRGLKVGLAAIGATFALGGGAFLAASPVANHDGHGDAVSKAAVTCPSPSADDAHGDCVSAVAASPTPNSDGSNGSANDAHGDAVSGAALTCPSSSATDRDAHGDCVEAVAKTHP
jgi:hypothetical protein